MTTKRSWLLLGAAITAGLALAQVVLAQSPEISMREFSSSQVKKGVRSLGLGGDGAVSGNYGLIWRDADTALVDYADAHFTNGNDFHFVAVGGTTPPLKHNLAIFLIAMFQNANNVNFADKSPGLGPNAVPVTGSGSDHAIFAKISMPIGKGISAGIMLAHETSQFDVKAVANPQQEVHYQSYWRPSGGLGIIWQPDKKFNVGFRGILNSDLERRTDSAGVREGMSRSMELRLGGSFMPRKGTLAVAGVTRLERRNDLAASHIVLYHPNLGVEQAFPKQHLVFRGGLDETSPTAGVSVRAGRFNLDTAYVNNLAKSRVGSLFGTHSNSILMTAVFNFGPKHAHETQGK